MPSAINQQPSTNVLTIKIIDNGRGIPEDILLKIKQGIAASSKKEGHGIGISSAIQNIKNWGGNYDIQSKVGEGTTFVIRLPIAKSPDWFQSELEIMHEMNVVVLDDDHSIHGVWDIRFQEYIKNNQVTLKHYHEPSEFIEYCESLTTPPICPAEANKSEGGLVSPEHCEGGCAKAGSPRRSQAETGENLPLSKTLFLMDYELLGFKETGLDLIEKLNLKDRVTLVTSRYEEPAIRDKIIKLGIKAIPKNFAPHITIKFK